VANALSVTESGAVGFIGWLDLLVSLLRTASAAPDAVDAKSHDHHAADVALNRQHVSKTKCRRVAQRVFDINNAGKESTQENKADTGNPRLSCCAIRIFQR
jgi:hypothetical protein